MSKATIDAMNMLHQLLAADLAQQITEERVKKDKEGNPVVDADGKFVIEATPASVLSVARQFLKDNQIELGKGEADSSAIARAMQEMADLPMDDEVPAEYQGGKH